MVRICSQQLTSKTNHSSAAAIHNQHADMHTSTSGSVTSSHHSCVLCQQLKCSLLCASNCLISGVCKRGRSCKFRHDPGTRRLCPAFLSNTCTLGDSCSLRHVDSRSLMPTCTNFLRGKCHDETCRFSHVRVNRDAPMCQDFLKGP